MTEAQRIRLYIPAWSEASAAMGWRMKGGRLQADLEFQSAAAWGYPVNHPLRELFPRLLAHARALAQEEHRAVTADDLRRACNLAASGWSKASSKKLTQREITKVVALFRLLVDAENLAALSEWEFPEASVAERLSRYIRRLAPEATVNAIAGNAFGTTDLASVPESRLRWLVGELKRRKAA